MQQTLIIGAFDGLHKGHQLLAQAASGPVVALLIANIPSLQSDWLYEPKQRQVQLQQHFQSVVHSYDVIEHNISAQAFFDQIISPLRCQQLVVGADFCFGKDNQNADFLRRLFPNTTIIPKDSQTLSSSTIRQWLKQGQIEQANAVLLEPYFREGVVIRGNQQARFLGWPTANITLKPYMVPLRCGSYVITVTYHQTNYPGVGFISYKNDQLVCETHLIGFSGDLYGKQLRFTFNQFIRPQQKFSGVQALQKAISGDLKQAQKWFAQSTN
ncbi:riboflavin biosynthesis protein RibF [Mycoplasmoides pneumoniae]|uniref:Bifunctional riboflavin kinase/FMN adenylyltransferase n=3 Tax=Mycoplasmoides pneumoniae TaxID=2104 RepID=RIBF_MYCPN|nr:riboflavin biosynthesis protein RibF [Mycoplasmoides pneumoniae]P75587.1 RecName: Full=Bifunctional riboflavin kinase/FMN adenylyltransferase; AltName: Full=Riboflavin biosynthesis protein RibF; Includes: RecName: Full=Riboflavin kinase; AltName: Full=Flavokinase; Includes: RecName: Full=FMN adenylyltransferase; AltName: Full=FAD pyrophosphorylase; AltName: Full=FAD synthase [Mycoplasmoides pneumoniae M129]AAB96321.1 riboflavin kinase/FMN adenylyltransferase [Mycoplasmoides pneumoniae M129]AD